jgi:glucose uptake protein GlcU
MLTRVAKQNIPDMTNRESGLGAFMGVFFCLSLGGTFWALSLLPQIKAQPIFLVTELICPTLIGLFLFKERKGLTWREWGYFAIGIAGGMLVALH